MSVYHRVMRRLLAEAAASTPTPREMAVTVHVGEMIKRWERETRSRSGIELRYVDLAGETAVPLHGLPSPNGVDLRQLRKELPTIASIYGIVFEEPTNPDRALEDESGGRFTRLDALEYARDLISRGLSSDRVLSTLSSNLRKMSAGSGGVSADEMIEFVREHMRLEMWPGSAFNVDSPDYRDDIVPKEFLSLVVRAAASGAQGSQSDLSLTDGNQTSDVEDAARQLVDAASEVSRLATQTETRNAADQLAAIRDLVARIVSEASPARIMRGVRVKAASAADFSSGLMRESADHDDDMFGDMFGSDWSTPTGPGAVEAADDIPSTVEPQELVDARRRLDDAAKSFEDAVGEFFVTQSEGAVNAAVRMRIGTLHDSVQSMLEELAEMLSTMSDIVARMNETRLTLASILVSRGIAQRRSTIDVLSRRILG